MASAVAGRHARDGARFARVGPRRGRDGARRGGPIDRRLLQRGSAARAHFMLAGLLGAVSAALIIAQAALIAHAIDRAVMHGASLSSLRVTLIALGAVLAARALTGAGFELSGRLGAMRVLSQLRRRLIQALLIDDPAGSVGRARRERTGELAATAVQGVDALQAYFAGYLPQLMLAGIVPVAVAVWVATLDPPAAGILALTAPLLIVFMVLIGKRAAAQTESRRRALTLLSAHFLDVVRGLAELRVHRRERAQAQTLAAVGERYRAETMASLRVAFLSALVLELCAMIGIALVAATVGVQLVDGALRLQAGLTVLLLAPEMYGPLREVGRQFHAGADGTAAASRIFAALDERRPAAGGSGRAGAPAWRMPGGLPALRPGRQLVQLHGITHRYPDRSDLALDGFELALQPGELVLLTGRSGAGKSTVASLLLRLIEPTHGEITCGGEPLGAIPLERWREQIAWVPQRPTIFTGTVAENIALAEPDACRCDEGRRRIAAAAQSAHAADFIASLPDGLQTLLGDGGRRLSAGQERRIALARAFMRRRAGLLILDEPTAHLDAACAAEVAGSIRSLASGRTTLLIAHDPALAEIADRVLAVRDGRLAGVSR